jgi:hypothetical protein
METRRLALDDSTEFEEFGGIGFPALGVSLERGDVQAVAVGEVPENALEFREIEESDFLDCVVEIHEHLLDGCVGLHVVAAEARAQNDRLVLREGEMFCRVSERVNDDMVTGLQQGIRHGSHGIANPSSNHPPSPPSGTAFPAKPSDEFQCDVFLSHNAKDTAVGRSGIPKDVKQGRKAEAFAHAGKAVEVVPNNAVRLVAPGYLRRASCQNWQFSS